MTFSNASLQAWRFITLVALIFAIIGTPTMAYPWIVWIGGIISGFITQKIAKKLKTSRGWAFFYGLTWSLLAVIAYVVRLNSPDKEANEQE